MKYLSERTIALLFVYSMSTMVERYLFAEESLYMDEADEIYNFCKWIDDEIGGCSSRNIQMLFKAYKNPNDELAQAEAQKLKGEIERIKNLTI
jgi:hypothetical protein